MEYLSSVPIFVLLPVLIAVSYALVNVGSKNKVPLAKIALPLVVVCVIVYFAYPLCAPLVNFLIQSGTHLPMP